MVYRSNMLIICFKIFSQFVNYAYCSKLGKESSNHKNYLNLCIHH